MGYISSFSIWVAEVAVCCECQNFCEQLYDNGHIYLTLMVTQIAAQVGLR